MPQDVGMFTDTDWAGCKKTRKSTSGGIAMIGTHIIKSYSSTQGVIALSSGEAEYYGLTKGASVALGIAAMCSDMGLDFKVHISTDASAAKGIAMRIGLGKVRHLETTQLWLQEKVADGVLTIAKIKGTDNCADAMTKYLTGPGLAEHCHKLTVLRTNVTQTAGISTK